MILTDMCTDLKQSPDTRLQTEAVFDKKDSYRKHIARQHT